MKISKILSFAVIGSIFCGSLISKDVIKNVEDMNFYEAVEIFLPCESLKVGGDAKQEVEEIINDFVNLSSENFIILLTEGYKKAPGLMSQDGIERTLLDFFYELEFSNRVIDLKFYGNDWKSFKTSHRDAANLCLELLRKRPDLLVDPEIQELIKTSFIEDIYKECDDFSKLDKNRINEIRIDMICLANNPFSLLSKAYPDKPEFSKLTMMYAIPQTIVDFFIKITSALSKEPLKSKVEEILAQRSVENLKEDLAVDQNEKLVEEVEELTEVCDC